MSHSVERSVTLWHEFDLVVLVHFWEVVAIRSKLSTGRVPPDWEMFFDRTSEVRAVGRRLSHQLMEGLLGSLPLSSLDIDEHSCRNCNWQAKNPSCLHVFDNWTSQWVAEPVTGNEVADALSRHLLKHMLEK